MRQSAVATAMVRWLASATGLEVRLSDQDAPEAATDWCTVRVAESRDDGGTPAKSQDYDAGRPPGEELEVTHAQKKFLTVTLQSYTREPVGATCATDVLEAAKESLLLEAPRAQLAALGVAVLTKGAVRNLNALGGPKWRGRAVLELEVNVVEAVTERMTYIETADVTVVEES